MCPRAFSPRSRTKHRERPTANGLLASAGVLAGATLIALLASGGTYALLSDAQAVTGAAIRSGSMTFTINNASSATVSDATWKNLLPGDSVFIPFDVKNTGDVTAAVASRLTSPSSGSGLVQWLTWRLGTVATRAECVAGFTALREGSLATWSAATGLTELTANQSAVGCVEIRLNSDAPMTVAGSAAAFSLVLTATQKAGS